MELRQRPDLDPAEPRPDRLRSIGTFTVTLTASNSSGSTRRRRPSRPTPRACAGGRVHGNPRPGKKNSTPFDVTDGSTNMSTAGCNAQWSWDFGDGQGSTLQDPPNHVYAKGTTRSSSRSRTSAARRAPHDWSRCRIDRAAASPAAALGRERRGQTLAEFALALPIFLFILMAIFDFGRAIYMYNGVSQAARELARVTSVHPCAGNPCTLGASAETTAVLNTQRSLIPNLQTPTYTCVDIDGKPINSATTCLPGNQVKVRIVARYAPITPLLGLTGTWDLQSTSSVSIQ